jgi:hypothetical protein
MLPAIDQAEIFDLKLRWRCACLAIFSISQWKRRV